MDVYELMPRFKALFQGLDTAFGTGAGRWVKRPPTAMDWVAHLNGEGAGMGIAPLRPTNDVMFAAIDLDEPDFDAAFEMQDYIPGKSFVESSRSGNAHVWVFFDEPCAAWLAMGILKEATLAAGKKHVEVFPKNYDFSRVKLGNYINLPYHGKSRPILSATGDEPKTPLSLIEFLDLAEARKCSPADWERRNKFYQIQPPEARENSAAFGTQKHLHICADALISGDVGPITEGHRANVFFMLAKCLTNWDQVDSEEALDLLRSVNNNNCTPPVPDHELVRILGNAERGRFTSTGCDEPTVTPFTHPDCPILRRA